MNDLECCECGQTFFVAKALYWHLTREHGWKGSDAFEEVRNEIERTDDRDESDLWLLE